MTKLGHLLQEFLDLTGWSGEIWTEENGDVHHLGTGATIDDQPCRIHVSTVDSLDSLAVFVYPPFRVKPSKHAEACKLINAINYQTLHGRFEIDPGDGELRYCNSADVEFCQPTAAFVRSMVLCGGGILTGWMPALAEVAMTEHTADGILAQSKVGDDGAAEPVAADATQSAAPRGRSPVTLH